MVLVLYMLLVLRDLIVYDKLAPTNFSTLQTPSLVLILWTLLVSGSIQHASKVSRVVRF